MGGENLIVVLITYNRLEYTKRTIESLLRTVPDAMIVIYDNCSTEAGMVECLESFASKYVRVFLRFAKENGGWGKAVNEAMKEIEGEANDFILISNNDVEYKDGWYEKAVSLYDKYNNLGVLGLWKSPNHGVLQDLGDLVVKDQMPAVAWFLKPAVMQTIGLIAEHGPCPTKGGNGEDVDYCLRAADKGLWVAGPKEDLAIHLDP